MAAFRAPFHAHAGAGSGHLSLCPTKAATGGRYVAILTGASRGIGRVIAVDLAKAGYGVAIVARSDEGLQATRRACLDAVPTADILCCAVDVCKPRAARAIVEAAVRHFGRITALVNNVGVNLQQALSAGCHGERSADDAAATLRRVLHVNLGSVMELTMEALPHLLRNAVVTNGGGSNSSTDDPSFSPSGHSTVVFVSSMLGKQVALVPGHAAYAAAKSGLTGFASGLWAEVRQNGVLVSTLYPGLVATDMGDGFSSEFGSLINKKVPPAEYLQPSDVSHAVMSLLNQPRTACISDVQLQPQRDLFRQALFANVPALRALVKRPGRVPFVDARVALVTGAGKGIGRAVVLGLVQDGFNGVTIIARNKGDLKSLAEECNAINPRCQVLVQPLDVADTEKLKAAVERTVESFGTLSVVVSNAGVNRRRNAALCQDSGKVWEDVTAVNLLAGMHLTRVAAPHLMRHAHLSGRPAETMVCFVNSHYAQPTQQVLPGGSIYITTKTGLSGFAEALMEDVRDMGVKVVTLFPGLVNTDLGRARGPIERKYNNAAQTAEDMIQCSDIVYAVRYALSCSTTACPTQIVTQTTGHTLPLIRRQCKRFMEAHAPTWVATKCKL